MATPKPIPPDVQAKVRAVGSTARAQRAPVAGKPKAPPAKTTTKGKGAGASKPAAPPAALNKPPKPTQWMKPREGFTKGVGGQCYFKLAVAKRNNATGGYSFDDNNAVLFEMAPARRSFADKQGQTVPGVGAGMDFSTRTNIAKLNVPGARPLYQHMGIAEERIEFVGSFVGFDEYITTKDGPTWDTGAGDNHNAWEKSQRLAYAVRAGKEMGLFLGWEDPNNEVGAAVTAASGVNELNGLDHPIRFDNNHVFRGYVHSIVRTYATAQRVYYRVSFIVTNHEDVMTGPSSNTQPVPLPGTLATFSDFIPSNTDSDPNNGSDPGNANAAGAQEQGAASGTVAAQPPTPPSAVPAAPVLPPSQQQAIAALQKFKGQTATARAEQGLAAIAANLPPGSSIVDAYAHKVKNLAATTDSVSAFLSQGSDKRAVDYLKELAVSADSYDRIPGDEKVLEMVQQAKAVAAVAEASNYRPVTLPGQAPAAAAPVKPAPAKPAGTPPKVAAAARPVQTPEQKPVTGTAASTYVVENPVFGNDLNAKMRQTKTDAENLLVAVTKSTGGIASSYVEKESARIIQIVAGAGRVAADKKTQMGEHAFGEVSKGLGYVVTQAWDARKENEKKLAAARTRRSNSQGRP